MAELLCNHCEKFFPGSPKHKNRLCCNRPGCQKARKAAWQRKKMCMDSDYRLNQKLCNKNWAKTHPDYWKEYRRKNPKKAERNRMLQSLRNRRRSRKQELSAKMDTSAIAKMDASISPQNLASGQFWLVPAIAKMDAEKGQNLFRTNGCLGCHSIGAEGDLFASDLSNVGNKVKPDWLINWLLDPHAYDSNTIMPNFRLSTQEAKDISTFLLTQKTKPIAKSSEGEPTPVRKWLNVKMPAFQLGEDEIFYIMRYFGDVNGGLPKHLGAKILPMEDTPVSNGGRLFSHYCSPCHGDKGMGDGFNSANLDPTPRDLSDAKEVYMGKQENEDLFKVISLGGKAVEKSPRMPPYGNTLSEKEIWEIIGFVRTLHSYEGETIDFKGLQTKRPQKAAEKISPEKFKSIKKKAVLMGKSLYKKLGCSACHKIGGQGGIVGPELTHVSKRLNSAWVYEFLLSPQHMLADVTMPNYGLNNKKALSLATYLHSLN